MEASRRESLLVEDALEEVQYRVYPETPLTEVVDLMVRRELHSLPVVGEQYEVLGIITTGDALDRLLRESPAETEGVATARDIMTRAVLCVSEAQPLMEAARMMVNKKVDQLPVVRDGELVGLVTRDAILGALHADAHDPDNKTNDDS